MSACACTHVRILIKAQGGGLKCPCEIKGEATSRAFRTRWEEIAAATKDYLRHVVCLPLERMDCFPFTFYGRSLRSRIIQATLCHFPAGAFR